MATIVITGTSTGIGLATAVVLGRAGHDVFATMRNPDRSPELKSIAEQENLPITILSLDVNEDDSVAHAIKQVIASRGQIDVLVNNAGIGLLGSVEKMELSIFQQTIETNFFGALRCIQAVLPGMREPKSGCIINVSSVSGRMVSPGQSAYCSSKYALEALSEALAAEVKAYNIRVAIVEPGIINTPIFGKGGDLLTDSHYSHARRMDALYSASLQHPVSPFIVGEKIHEIIESNSWQLRYPVGPDAEGFLAWRSSLSDEDFVSFGAIDDDEWCEYLHSNFGLDVRSHLK
jgi:NAD(P)-dependent dehydrogenase (short-subunit alcohol dehydrogenase family)